MLLAAGASFRACLSDWRRVAHVAGQRFWLELDMLIRSCLFLGMEVEHYLVDCTNEFRHLASAHG